MKVTRRNFMGTAAMFATAGLQGAQTSAKSRPEVDYSALCQELRAFYPDETHGKCKAASFDSSTQAIRDEAWAWANAHPGFDALDIRRAFYASIRKHFVPFLFRESPFYCEAGINGGWCEQHNPSRRQHDICGRFYDSKNLVPRSAFERKGERHRQRYSLCCGHFVDSEHHVPAFHAVFTKGFKGVFDATAAALAACPKEDALGRKFFETALDGLETVHVLQMKFAEAAEKRLAEDKLSSQEKRFLQRIVESAKRCPWEPPRTFFEGLNTLWFMREIPAFIEGLDFNSLGRPDAWLIGFYRAEIAAGTLTEEEARDLVARWMIVSDCHQSDRYMIHAYADQEAEMPVTLGGCDADGQPVWNEVTRMFLEEHQRNDLIFPKLHVRFDENSPQEYLALIARMVVEGHAVFAMFNDKPTVACFLKHGLPLQRARDYVCCGCWDPSVDTETDFDTANYMSTIRVLEATIHKNPDEERRAGVRMDPIDAAQSFDEVKKIYFANFMRFFRDTVSDYTRYGRSAAEVSPHPAYSVCLTGCLANRRDSADYGTAFRPKIMTLAFTANLVDSLCAIRKVCFEDKKATLKEFLDAVRSNWSGPRGEELRTAALASPYWGDNTPASNELMNWFFTSVANDLDGLRSANGGPYVLAAWIYREFIMWGKGTKATPDGRRNGELLAQGFAPSEYRCKEGVTTVINAIGTAPHNLLYASNANLTFEKSGLTPELLTSVFRVFAKKGGHLLQPNCNSVEELLDAQKHPERHQSLIVKVCGYSARFISLSKQFQDEVIARHRLK